MTEADVDVNTEGVRQQIARILGLSMIAEAVPHYLEGENPIGISAWLSREDLGNLSPLYDEWKNLIDWRVQEAIDLATVLRYTAELVAQALAIYQNADLTIEADMTDLMSNSPALHPEDHYEAGDEISIRAYSSESLNELLHSWHPPRVR